MFYLPKNTPWICSIYWICSVDISICSHTHIIALNYMQSGWVFWSTAGVWGMPWNVNLF